ncbi:hypothetical protein M514_07506 [Trichuris suis]|uniref:Follistatin-related protein 1 n=1 Tax=Trichuris suis TaxID=68888 RepID=A0A085NE68_9BILA|nr:hypothetical protein M513_07506 [Trichuris suis]KFD67764.1 hypothetical protein M514_07506 [Trichuris suis]
MYGCSAIIIEPWVEEAFGSDLEEDLCRTVTCRAGENCVLENNVAQCKCIQWCRRRGHPVCGNDSVTYPSRCHLHSEACKSNKRIHIAHEGKCFNAPTRKANQTEPRSQLRTYPSTAVTPAYDQSTPSAKCTFEDYVTFVQNIAQNYRKHAGKARQTGTQGDRKLLWSTFSKYDNNSDGQISKEEFAIADRLPEKKAMLPAGCHHDILLRYADMNADGKLDFNEFKKMLGLPEEKTNNAQSVKYHMVEAGNHYQLFCDAHRNAGDASRVIWYRYNNPMANTAPYNFEISRDGSLYLTPATLIHNGNFSCNIGFDDSSGQTHTVLVTERPLIELTPHFALLKVKESLHLRCDILAGHPFPRIRWSKNGVLLPNRDKVLTLRHVQLDDTGTYRCKAENSGGEVTASSSVVVRQRFEEPERYLRHNAPSEDSKLAVLYKEGLRFFDSKCSLQKAIPTYSIPCNQTNSSNGRKTACRWRDAVATQPARYIYAIIEGTKAVVKINTANAKVEQVLKTSREPTKLHYLWWEDALWIESTIGGSAESSVILEIVKYASKPIVHGLTHTLTLSENLKIDLILLPDNEPMKYGYVGQRKEKALYKLDVHSITVVNRISLTSFDCSPHSGTLLTSVGLLILHCDGRSNDNQQGGQLVIDYLSDMVLSFDGNVHGIPSTTDDEKYLISVEPRLGRFLIQSIGDKALKMVHTVDEYLPLKAWTTKVYGGNIDDAILYGLSSFSDRLIAVTPNSSSVKQLFKLGNAENYSTYVDGRSNSKLVQIDRRSHYLAAASTHSVSIATLLNPSVPLCTATNLNEAQVLLWM